MYRGMMACEYQCKKFLSTSKYISEIETISDIGDVTKMFFSCARVQVKKMASHM